MKKICIWIAAVSAGLAVAVGGASAQTDRAPVSTISELLDRVRADARDAAQENQRRLEAFRADRSRQATLVQQAQARLNELEAEANANQQLFDENQVLIEELDAQLREEQGQFGELFGAARQTAGEFGSLIEGSLISAQFPDRHEPLVELAESRTLPEPRELEQIYQIMIDEMNAQAEVARFETQVLGLNDGAPVDVVRVGAFVAFAEANGVQFVRWATDEDNRAQGYRLSLLETQPPGRILGAAAILASAQPGEIARGPVDPTRGGLLEIYKDMPDRAERFQQGGTVAWIIAGLFVFSFVFGIFRLILLLMTSSAVAAQKRRASGSRSNPLGRVVLAYEEVKDRSIETIELKLDEAILRETPKFEFGLNFMKLAAAVSPLLGLLGTVTGMITTFTQITLFGTGDPRIMAGGISEALVTTLLGLYAAIPLLFVHSFAASFARGIQQTLEEQAAGIVARHAEETGAR